MSSLVEHVVHENGIHEIIFHDSSRAAVDAYMDLLESIAFEHVEAGKTVLALVNFTQVHTIPPIAYLTKKGRGLIHEHLGDRDKLHLRGAMLAPSEMQITLSLAQTFINLLPIDFTMQTFLPEQRSAAIDWILGNG